ncbi:MAG: hypothetical protein IRZ06_03125 [Nevskia sp.]|jgi:hypothetical protein|nr:hypothetical protein [Nevskia sp.]
MNSVAQVARLGEFAPEPIRDFLAGYGLRLKLVAEGEDIPASYWGAPEAGLIGNTLYARADTPLHSILHTACHWLCMDPARRLSVHTDAGGDDAEEVAVCYLQCLLADAIPGYGRSRLFADMDAWGYHFRLGSARRWFEEDAEDARAWLARAGLLEPAVIDPQRSQGHTAA